MKLLSPDIAWQVVITISILLSLFLQFRSITGRNGKCSEVRHVTQKHCDLITSQTRNQIGELDRRLAAVSGRVDAISNTHTQAVDALRRELKSDLDQLNQRNLERDEKIHHRIDEILAAVSELRGETVALRREHRTS